MSAVLKIVPIERMCKSCTVVKPISEFHLYGPRQVSWKCKSCHIESERKRQKALWASDPAYRERHNAAGKAYRRGDVRLPIALRNETTERNCAVCGVTKLLADFPLRPAGNRLRTCSRCYKDHENEKARIRYRDDLEYRAKKSTTKVRKKRVTYKSQTREYIVQHFYGVTLDYVQRTLDSQHGLCANRACGAAISWTAPKAAKDRAVIDHDHATGKFRAVLCHPCNTLLGHVEKDLNRILGLVDYSAKHRE